MEALRSWKEEILNIREEGRAGVKINQAEELAGITRKNIRFYEEQGLIKPGRNPENSYREYSLRDVEQLKRIKLMRMLGVPCGKIREMESGGLSLKQCTDDQIMELQNSIRTSERMQEICAAVSSERVFMSSTMVLAHKHIPWFLKSPSILLFLHPILL